MITGVGVSLSAQEELTLVVGWQSYSSGDVVTTMQDKCLDGELDGRLELNSSPNFSRSPSHPHVHVHPSPTPHPTPSPPLSPPLAPTPRPTSELMFFSKVLDADEVGEIWNKAIDPATVNTEQPELILYYNMDEIYDGGDGFSYVPNLGTAKALGDKYDLILGSVTGQTTWQQSLRCAV